jgi:peptidyl-prolyl cis-trans isomerase SurA
LKSRRPASYCLSAIGVGLLLAPVFHAEIIDRIAVSVANRVITATDIDREIRVTALLNGVKPDFSPAARRSTANRLVEQKLIRRELENSRYPVPTADEVAPLLDQFKKGHFANDEEFDHALAEAGITGQDVIDELLWQRTLLLFIDVRFRPGVQVTPQEIQDYFDKTVKPAAEAAKPGTAVSLDDYRDRIEQTLIGQRVDEQVDTWLKGARSRTEVVFHDEVFQ